MKYYRLLVFSSVFRAQPDKPLKTSPFADSSQPLTSFGLLPGLGVAFPGSIPADQNGPPPQPITDQEGLLSSGSFLRLGFSFVVGLAIGYALKVAFKIALTVGGLLLILLFSLQYSGIIEINWTGMESNYDSFVDWSMAYAGALKTFIANHLSSAASFTAGLLLGLRL